MAPQEFSKPHRLIFLQKKDNIVESTPHKYGRRLSCMAATNSDSEILELVLKAFRKEFVSPLWIAPLFWLIRSIFWIKRLIVRPSPTFDYALLYSKAGEYDVSGDVVGVWRITRDVIEKMPNDFDLPKRDCSKSSY